jgi:predicted DNA-binding transcriptional regulator YafY
MRYLIQINAPLRRHAAQHRFMRYGPAENLFRLARHLAGTRVGLTLDEMAAELAVGRRTAERLRDTLLAMFPQMESWDDEGRVRRWRLPGSALAGVVSPRVEAVAAVETAARECGAHGEADRAALLREAAITLRAVMHPDALRRAEPDIAALTEAEGIAMRPGPRPLIAPGVLATLRHAILGMRLVRVHYAAAEADAPVTRVLCPYGLLYGGRGWLVAHVEGLPEMRLWRLDRIASVDLLDRGFARREEFSLEEYAVASFGVFQEEPMDVVLRFAPEAAEDAAGWMFHPTQTMQPQADGSLIVRFRAGGEREMCWHLFTWGTGVTVIEPHTLRSEMEKFAHQLLVHHSQHQPKAFCSLTHR